MTPELDGWLGRRALNGPEFGAEQRGARCAHGLLVAGEQDPRLSWPARELVRQLGAKLYCPRSGSRR